MAGTNFFTVKTSTVNVALTDKSNNAMFIQCAAGSLPSAVAGYATGCIAMATDTGVGYMNTGSATSCTFTAFNSASALTIPSAFTDSATTTGQSFQATASAITTGQIFKAINGNTTNFTTGASLFYGDLGTATAGNGLTLVGTGVYAGTGILLITANSATTGTLASISGTGLTTGVGLLVTGGGANMTAAGIAHSIVMGAATVGSGLKITTTGIYTGTTGLLNLSATTATTGTLAVITGTGLTTGIGLQIVGTAATLTTGRYVSINDTTTGEVFGVGLNGHIISTVSASAASAASTVNQGISAAAIVANSTDTAGGFTTTGTQNNTSDSTITVTFGKTYTTAPKAVILTAANAAGASGQVYISSITATTFVVGFAKSASWAATPAYNYIVIA